MKRTIAVLALAAGAVLLVQGVTAASPGVGQGPCQHGTSNKACRPDPQPNHGKDCLKHGKNGGLNQDHCIPAEGTPTPTPTPTVGVTPTPTTSVQGVTLTKSTVGATQLAKTGSKASTAVGGIGLMVFGMGLLLHTFNKKRAPQL
jgi:LPXTG-motif cell wall-anchored protein